ncbi:MAG: hypothetical protein ACYCVH_00310 [Ignavibacteriaceae bacterium]
MYDIIFSSLLILAAILAVFVSISYIVYKIKNKDKTKPYLRKTFIENVNSNVDATNRDAHFHEFNYSDQIYSQPDNSAVYLNQLPVFYIQKEDGYYNNASDQNLLHNQAGHSKRLAHKIYHRQGIKFK